MDNSKYCVSVADAEGNGIQKCPTCSGTGYKFIPLHLIFVVDFIEINCPDCDLGKARTWKEQQIKNENNEALLRDYKKQCLGEKEESL